MSIEPSTKPKMQFNLSALVWTVVSFAVLFGAIKLIQSAQDEGISAAVAFGLLGWVLLAAFAIMSASTQLKASQNYRTYLDEIRSNREESKRANDEAREINRRVEDRADQSTERGLQILDLQKQVKALLQEILDELRKK